MASLQRVMKWSHEGFRHFFVKILTFIFVKEILFYTGKSPLEAHLIQRDTEIHLICPLSVKPLITLMDRNVGL